MLHRRHDCGTLKWNPLTSSGMLCVRVPAKPSLINLCFIVKYRLIVAPWRICASVSVVAIPIPYRLGRNDIACMFAEKSDLSLSLKKGKLPASELLCVCVCMPMPTKNSKIKWSLPRRLCVSPRFRVLSWHCLFEWETRPSKHVAKASERIVFKFSMILLQIQ